MHRTEGHIRVERIRQPSEVTCVVLVITRRTSNWVPGGLRRTGPLPEDRATVSEQNEQVSRAVVVGVDDRPSLCVRLRIELFDEIRLTVEVPVRFATDENAPLVILFDVGATVEIAVNVDSAELSATVVATPSIGATIAVVILCLHLLSNRPDFDCSHGGTGHDAQKRHAPGRQALHLYHSDYQQQSEADNDRGTLQK